MPGFVSAMVQGPWGGKNDEPGKDGDGSGGRDGGPRNPWTQPTRPGGGKGSAAIDELLRRGRESFGQGGGGFGGLPQGPAGKALWPIAIVLILILWLALTCIHRVGPQERGVVTMLGKYSRTLSPGTG